MQDTVLKSLPTTALVALRSASLAQVAYDRHREILQVLFRDGAVYQYATVPIQTYYDLLRADSKGSYFTFTFVVAILMQHFALLRPTRLSLIRATPHINAPSSMGILRLALMGPCPAPQSVQSQK